MASASQGLGLAGEITELLQLDLEEGQFLEALENVSDILPENTAQNRRKLKSTVEQRQVDINLEFLQAAQAFMSVRPQVVRTCRPVHTHCLRAARRPGP